MYSKVFEIIQTKEDLNLVRQEIDLLRTKIYQTNKEDFNKTLRNEVRKSFSEAISDEIKDQDHKAYLDGLEKALENVEEIKLQIAYELSVRNLAAIKEWVSENISEFVVLDIYYNPTVVGGASISYKGKYYDGTLSSKIEEYSLKMAKDKSSKISQNI